MKASVGRDDALGDKETEGIPLGWEEGWLLGWIEGCELGLDEGCNEG